MPGDVGVPVTQTNQISSIGADMNLSVSFDYKVAGGSNRFNVDFNPDPLPQQSFTATTTKQHADWQVSSSSSAMKNSKIRFFDDLTDSNEKDITIMNVMLSKSTTQSVTYGSTYGTLPSPSRTGYVFAGWYTASEGGSRITSDSTVSTAGNHTLYARWNIIPVWVFYHANGGTTGNGYTTINGGWVSSNGSGPFYQTVTWSNDLYDYGTFGITKSNNNAVAGAEWCTSPDGTGTCPNQSLVYTYDFLKSLSNGNVTDGAYQVHFYMHWTPASSPSTSSYNWKVFCACYGSSTFSRWVYGDGGYATADAATGECQMGAVNGLSKCSNYCRNNQGTYQSHGNCTAVLNN